MTKNQAQKGPKINLVNVDSLTFYQITEDELSELEKGSPGSIYLNFSIFLLSVAIAFLVVLLTTKIDDMRIYTLFLVFTIIGFIGGLLLLILWFRDFRSSTSVVKKIRSRKKLQEGAEKLKAETNDPNSTIGDTKTTG